MSKSAEGVGLGRGRTSEITMLAVVTASALSPALSHEYMGEGAGSALQ
jgi:hypothetical protein